MPFSDYTQIRAIGSGSFGHAYLVQFGQHYRVMKQVDMANMGQRDRANAEGEVKVLSKLKHPYIVRYWESFVHEDKLCIIMDYCDGGNLFRYIEKQKKQRALIAEPTVMRWFTQMCLALKYMHDDKHVLHRDIKPQNVLLCPKEGGPQGCVKIADFGISKVVGCGFARTRCGTPYYLSPEQCQQKLYGYGCDVWAMGCVLYQLCAQRVPFDAQSIQALVERISTGPLPPAPVGYTREVAALITDMLDRNAARRPSCAVILQRPRVQQEIQAMYADHREQRAREGERGAAVAAVAGGAAGAVAPSTDPPRHDLPRSNSPMRDLPAVGRQPSDKAQPHLRGRSASPARRLRSKEPSPQRGAAAAVAAQEVLRPKDAAAAMRSPSKPPLVHAQRGGG
jgi:NIMA (never in mitosis gene a)-related kinase